MAPLHLLRSVAVLVALVSLGCARGGPSGPGPGSEEGGSADAATGARDVATRPDDGQAPANQDGSGSRTPDPDGARPFDPSLLDQPYDGDDKVTAQCNTLPNTAPLVRIEGVVASLPAASQFTGGPVADAIYEMLSLEIYGGPREEGPGNLMQRTIAIGDGGRVWELVEKYSFGPRYAQSRGRMKLEMSGSTLTISGECGHVGNNVYQYVIRNDLLVLRFERGASIVTYRRR
jgi:hypothetical protein